MENRRSFLKKSGTIALGTFLIADPFLKALAAISGRSLEDITAMYSHTCDIIRINDFLYNRYYFVNLELNNNGTLLIKKNTDRDAFLVVRIPQQHIAEEVKRKKTGVDGWDFDTSGEIIFPNENINNFSESFLSGFSYITLRLKKNKNSLNYDVKTIENWNDFDLLTLSNLEEDYSGIPLQLFSDKQQYPLYPENIPSKLAAAQIGENIIPITLLEVPYKMFLSPVVPFLRPEQGTTYKLLFSGDNQPNQYYDISDKKDLILKKKTLTELWSNNIVFQSSNPSKGINQVSPSFKISAYEEESKNIAEVIVASDKPTDFIEGEIAIHSYFLLNTNGEKIEHKEDATVTSWNKGELILNLVFSGDEHLAEKSIITGTSSNAKWVVQTILRSNSNADKNTFLIPRPRELDRSNLAKLTNIKNDFDRDVASEYFNISSLGATTYLKYFNLDEKKLGLVGWKQDIKLGRDNYVEITEKAIDTRTTLKLLISDISERRVEKGKSVLIYRRYFKYLEKEKEFDPPTQFNNFVFRKIIAMAEGAYYSIKKEKENKENEQDGFGDENYFIPLHEAAPREIIKMPYVGIDAIGNQIEFTMDLMIIKKWKSAESDLLPEAISPKKESERDPNDIYFTQENVSKALLKHNERVAIYSAKLNPVHEIHLNKRKISYVKDEKKAKNTSSEQTNNAELVTQQLQFHSLYANDYESLYPLVPSLKYATVQIPQLEGIETDQKFYPVNYSESYLKYALSERNMTQVFLQTLTNTFNCDPISTVVIDLIQTQEIRYQQLIQEIKPKVESIKNIFSDNYKNVGSLINPDIVIQNISLLKQGISLTDEINNHAEDLKNIKPADILRGVNAEIMGGVDLVKILKNIIPIEDSPVYQMIETADQGYEILAAADKYYNDLKEKISTLPSLVKDLSEQLKAAELGTTDDIKILKSYLDKYFEKIAKLKNLETILDREKDTILLLREKSKTLAINFLTNLEEKLKGYTQDDLDKDPKKKTLFTFSIYLKDFFTNPVFLEKTQIFIALFQILDQCKRNIKTKKQELNTAFTALAKMQIKDSRADLINKKNLFTDAVNYSDAIQSEFLKIQSDLTLFLSESLIGFFKLFEPCFSLFLEKHPEFGKECLLFLLKNHFYSLTESEEEKKQIDLPAELLSFTINNKDLSTILKENFSIILLNSKTFTLENNIDSILNLISKNADQLNQISEKLYKAHIDAYNSVIETSLSFIQKEKDKVDAEINLLNSQLRIETATILKKIEKEMSQLQIFQEIKDTVFYFQEVYTEFEVNISKAETAYNKGYCDLVDFKSFIKNEKTNLPVAEKQLKKLLETELRSLTTNPAIIAAEADEITKFIGQVVNIPFKDIGVYTQSFSSIEVLLKSKLDNLFGNKLVDPIRQGILNSLEKKRQELRDAEVEIKDFLSNKITYFKGQLEQATQELINAYGHGEAVVKAAKDKLKTAKQFLDQLTAINKKEINYSWKTENFDDADLGIVKFIKGKRTPTRLEIDVKNTIEYEITNFPPKVNKITCSTDTILSNFTLNFLSILSVEFDKVSFTGGTDSKEKFDVAIRDVRFDGPLNFVEVFQSFLKTLDKGLRLDVSAAGASLGYELALPNISGGAFTFAKAKLVMDLRLPFKAGVPMRFTFGLNDPQNMFLVTAGIFGGRGCFMIAVEPKHGVVMILLVIEFGGVLYLNIGVAEGMVFLFAGIYIKKEYDKVELKGYLTCGGVLNILDLISASITFTMGLQGTGKYLEGYCTIIYKIKICKLITIRVGMSMYKQIYGSPGSSSREPEENLNENISALLNESGNEDTDKEKNIQENDIKFWDNYFAANFHTQTK